MTHLDLFFLFLAASLGLAILYLKFTETDPDLGPSAPSPVDRYITELQAKYKEIAERRNHLAALKSAQELLNR